MQSGQLMMISKDRRKLSKKTLEQLECEKSWIHYGVTDEQIPSRISSIKVESLDTVQATLSGELEPIHSLQFISLVTAATMH